MMGLQATNFGYGSANDISNNNYLGQFRRARPSNKVFVGHHNGRPNMAAAFPLFPFSPVPPYVAGNGANN